MAVLTVVRHLLAKQKQLCIMVASFFATMDGAAAAAAASIASGDHPTVVCAACSQSSGPFSKRQLKKAQAGEPARKYIYGTQI